MITESGPTSGALLAGLIAGLGVALPIGAVAIYLVTLTARTSRRIGGAAALGVASADTLYALVAAVGGAELARRTTTVAHTLALVSAAVLILIALRLVVVAIRTWRAGHDPDAVARPAPGAARAYLSLLGLTLVNPTTVVYFVALIVGRGDGGLSVAERVGFVAGVGVASAAVQLGYAMSGALLGRGLVSRRAQLISGLLSGAVILGLAIRVAAR